jgi:DHA1 family bicyclomycin/chloramphenicol resistance-like MFS transporter
MTVAEMPKAKYFKLILILGSLTALGPFYWYVFQDLQELPTIWIQVFVSMTLSSYFIGISAGQLLYGPIRPFWTKETLIYWIISLHTSLFVFS